MPINLKKADLDPMCIFSQWEILNEKLLIQTLAWLYLRKPRHARDIIFELEPSQAGLPGKVCKNAISVLSIKMSDIAIGLKDHDEEIKRKSTNKRDKRIEQRDGLLFQHISWIAASIAMPNALTAPPHVRRADKGFDGLLIQMTDATDSISTLVLCEDKASINPKKLVQQSVWKEIDSILEGEKDMELLDAITALLEKHPGLDQKKIEEILHDLVFEKVRAFKVAVTTMPRNANSDGYQHIFNKFEQHALGLNQFRFGEVMESEDTRAFLKCLARSVRREIALVEKNV